MLAEMIPHHACAEELQKPIFFIGSAQSRPVWPRGGWPRRFERSEPGKPVGGSRHLGTQAVENGQRRFLGARRETPRWPNTGRASPFACAGGNQLARLAHQQVVRAKKRFREADAARVRIIERSEEHTSELQSRLHLVCRLLLEKTKKTPTRSRRTQGRLKRAHGCDPPRLTATRVDRAGPQSAASRRAITALLTSCPLHLYPQIA